MNNNDDGKWRPLSLKNSWYDDHFGFDAHASEVVENRASFLQLRSTRHDEVGISSLSIQRFFDLLEKNDADVGN